MISQGFAHLATTVRANTLEMREVQCHQRSSTYYSIIVFVNFALSRHHEMTYRYKPNQGQTGLREDSSSPYVARVPLPNGLPSGVSSTSQAHGGGTASIATTAVRRN